MLVGWLEFGALPSQIPSLDSDLMSPRHYLASNISLVPFRCDPRGALLILPRAIITDSRSRLSLFYDWLSGVPSSDGSSPFTRPRGLFTKNPGGIIVGVRYGLPAGCPRLVSGRVSRRLESRPFLGLIEALYLIALTTSSIDWSAYARLTALACTKLDVEGVSLLSRLFRLDYDRRIVWRD